MHSISKIIFLSAAMLFSSNAHMIMVSPAPMGKGQQDFNNSPLNNGRSGAINGGEYPCKVANTEMGGGKPTVMQIGSKFPVTFQGSAVHGGGSCQFSLSKDKAPTASSIFKVIHSVQGGCPARNQAGNLPGGAEVMAPDSYPVPIPEGLEPGSYTFAWTWVNKVGNREFYMNCAAVEVEGSGTGSAGFYESLPDMVVMNTNSDDCKSNEEGTGVYVYDNPGASLELNEANKQVVYPQCLAGGGKITGPGSGKTGGDPATGSGGGSGGNSNAPTPAATLSTPSASSTSGAGAGAGGGAEAPIAPANPTGSSSTNSEAPAQSSAVSSPSSNPVVPANDPSNPNTVKVPPQSDSGTSGTTACQPCTSAGFVCLTEIAFLNCAAAGSCAVPQQVAAGTKCVDGKIDAAVVEVRMVRTRKRAPMRIEMHRRWGHGRVDSV